MPLLTSLSMEITSCPYILHELLALWRFQKKLLMLLPTPITYGSIVVVIICHRFSLWKMSDLSYVRTMTNIHQTILPNRLNCLNCAKHLVCGRSKKDVCHSHRGWEWRTDPPDEWCWGRTLPWAPWRRRAGEEAVGDRVTYRLLYSPLSHGIFGLGLVSQISL